MGKKKCLKQLRRFSQKNLDLLLKRDEKTSIIKIGLVREREIPVHGVVSYKIDHIERGQSDVQPHLSKRGPPDEGRH
ncbi:hypothetical protein [uncultured Intestinimonas sp.]|uniref:hypothetical protein n=1 Tax=uncultured Intestinimonas sp. TaxID=1689265 RepID=UPI002637145D|nr:hypothetical protein [uncultured Intestinimonas sp.]